MRLLPHEIPQAVALLKAGQPVAMPTETVYGLAAPLFDAAAVARVFALKKRPADNPLIAHISKLEQVHLVAENFPGVFFLLAETFWPGPLTLVVPRKATVPDIVSAGHPTLAIRMPAHPVARALIDAVGPLVAPSANLSGKPSPTCAEHVLEDLDVPVLEGGVCSVGIESTVLSLVHEVPTLLRPGAISREELERVLGQAVVSAQANTPTLSPGMKYRHYAPKARVHLVNTVCDVRGSFVISPKPVSAHTHRPLTAQSLYRFFREADAQNVSDIWVLADSSLDEALRNRIEKAASG